MVGEEKVNMVFILFHVVYLRIMAKRNENGKTHKGYLTRFDARTSEGRALGQIEAALISALGTDVTPQELLILQRVSVKALRCCLIEREIVRKKGQVAPSLERNYLRFSRSLREDLKSLGLQRKEKRVKELTDYVRETYG